MFPRLSLFALLALASFQDDDNNYTEAFSTSPSIRSFISTTFTNGRTHTVSSSSLRMSSTQDEVAKLRAAAAKAREEAAKLAKVRET
jgi:hypothetical protein